MGSCEAMLFPTRDEETEIYQKWREEKKKKKNNKRKLSHGSLGSNSNSFYYETLFGFLVSF